MYFQPFRISLLFFISLSVFFSQSVLSGMFSVRELPVVFSDKNKAKRLQDNAFSATISDKPELSVKVVASSILGSCRDENQDRVMVSDRYVAVVDGSGSHGHVVAQHFAEKLSQGCPVNDAVESANSKIESTRDMGAKTAACFSLIEFTDSNVLKIHTAGDCTVVIMEQGKPYSDEELQTCCLDELVESYGGVMEVTDHFSLKAWLNSKEKEAKSLQYQLASSPQVLCKPTVAIAHSKYKKAFTTTDHPLQAKCRVCIFCDGLTIHPYELARLIINDTLDQALVKVHEVMEQRAGTVAAVHKGLAAEYGLQAYLKTHPSLSESMQQAINDGWLLPHDKNHEDNMTIAIVDISFSPN